MKEKTEEKWLGDIINVKGNVASSISSIKERKGRIYNAMNETIAIIEDCRMNRLGSLKSAADIFNLAIIPAMLSNSQTWEILDKNVQKECEDMQTYFLKRVLQVPNSVPKASLYYESNFQLVKYRLH